MIYFDIVYSDIIYWTLPLADQGKPIFGPKAAKRIGMIMKKEQFCRDRHGYIFE